MHIKKVIYLLITLIFFSIMCLSTHTISAAAKTNFLSLSFDEEEKEINQNPEYEPLIGIRLIGETSAEKAVSVSFVFYKTIKWLLQGKSQVRVPRLAEGKAPYCLYNQVPNDWSLACYVIDDFNFKQAPIYLPKKGILIKQENADDMFDTPSIRKNFFDESEKNILKIEPDQEIIKFCPSQYQGDPQSSYMVFSKNHLNLTTTLSLQDRQHSKHLLIIPSLELSEGFFMSAAPYCPWLEYRKASYIDKKEMQNTYYHVK